MRDRIAYLLAFIVLFSMSLLPTIMLFNQKSIIVNNYYTETIIERYYYNTTIFFNNTEPEQFFVELYPSADVFTVERGYGIQVENSGYLQTYYWIEGDQLYETYIQFKLLSIYNLSSINLKLTEVGGVNNNLTNFPIRVSLVSNNWDESDEIWETKPEEFGIATLIHLTKDTSDGYYRDYIFDLSDFIESIEDTYDTLITFYFRPNDLTVDFAYLIPKSSECSNITCRPKLTIGYL